MGCSYHEEQVWSDKIRSVSTYGSLAALTVNLLVFVLAIVIVEPWKRRRLAQTFEKRIEELSQETRELVASGTEALVKHIEEQDKVLQDLRVAVASSATAPISRDDLMLIDHWGPYEIMTGAACALTGVFGVFACLAVKGIFSF